jgi:hypothetical protein
MVFETACNFDLQYIWMVRAIFWLRAKILGARRQAPKSRKGLVAEMLDLGWGGLLKNRISSSLRERFVSRGERTLSFRRSLPNGSLRLWGARSGEDCLDT